MNHFHDPARHTRTPRPNPQVERVTRRSTSTPPVDNLIKLRHDLEHHVNQARHNEDQRRRACYGLLLAILAHYSNFGFRAGQREQVVSGLNELMARIGEGPEQVLEVNALWAAIPNELCRHEPDMTRLIMDRFVVAVGPNHAMRNRLGREIVAINRATRNNPDQEVRDRVLATAFGRLQTKI